MNNRLVIAGFVTCALLVANQTVISQTRQTESHRWEYCALTDSYGTGTKEKPYGIAVIIFFEEAGDRAEYVRADLEPPKEAGPGVLYDMAQKRAFAKALTRLGNEEWELVGSSPSPYLKLSNPNSAEAIFFKRPKRP